MLAGRRFHVPYEGPLSGLPLFHCADAFVAEVHRIMRGLFVIQRTRAHVYIYERTHTCTYLWRPPQISLHAMGFFVLLANGCVELVRNYLHACSHLFAQLRNLDYHTDSARTSHMRERPGMAHGVWRTAYGVRRMGYGAWGMVSGAWRMLYGV